MRMQLADLSPAAFPQDGFTFDRVFGMETMQEHIYSYGIQETVQGVCLASLLARTAQASPARRTSPFAQWLDASAHFAIPLFHHQTS